MAAIAGLMASKRCANDARRTADHLRGTEERMKLGLEWKNWLGRCFFAVTCIGVVATACSSDAPPLADLAAGCLVNTDCNNPLVCAFRHCHNACLTTRDCPAGLRCVASDRPFHVCQLQSERSCLYNSDCPKGQACASDGQCRDQCQGDADCLMYQKCVAGSCAELDELNKDGRLPILVSEGGPSTRQPCAHNSQCPPQLICRNNLCQMECLAPVDCVHGRQRVDHRCHAPLCPQAS